MPFDPSIPFKVDLPEPHRPLERYLTLRDMMDQRRVRESQMRRLEMQEQEGLEEQQEIQGIRELFRTNPKPTPADIYRVAPTKGGPIVKGMFDQLTQERAAAKAAEDLTAAKAKNKKDQQIILRNRQFALLQEPDEAKRQKLWGELAPELVELELSSPEDAANPAPDLPTLERMAGQYFTATEGPEKYQEYQTKILTERDRRAKDALERSQKQIELAGHYAGTVSDQPSYERWTSLLPGELRAVLDKDYSPEGMARAQSAMLTAQQRATAQQQAQPNAVGDFIRIATDPGSSREDQERADKALAMFSAQAKAGAGTTVIGPHQKVGDEAKLRDDFRQESKTYTIIRDAYTKIKGASESQTGPGDISLLYGYMRMLDPGSTVREGEFATAQNAGGVPERIKAYYNKLVSGERLEPSIRAQFVSEADKIYGQSHADHRKIRDRYRDITVRSGLDPENVVVDYSPAEVPRPQGPPQQPAPSGQPASAGGIPSPIVGVTVTTPNGRTYVFPDAAAANLFKKRTGIK